MTDQNYNYPDMDKVNDFNDIQMQSQPDSGRIDDMHRPTDNELQ